MEHSVCKDTWSSGGNDVGEDWNDHQERSSSLHNVSFFNYENN